MEEIIVKKADENLLKELDLIGFDSAYIEKAQYKYKGSAYKIFNLKPYEANILKQLCLSLGFDCAVSRDTVTCKCEKTDCLIFASISQLEKLTEKLKEQPFKLKFLSEKIKNILSLKYEPLKIRDTIFDWKRPYVMGILNVTPDSFSDGGLFNTCEKAFEHCLQLIDDGADIIDIGGESTRPDAVEITTEEEIKRVLPVIKKIRENNINIPISVDTRNYETAKQAIDTGADIINDVSGLDYDKNLFDFVTKNNIPTVIMHSDKVPAISANCTKGDLVDEVYISLEKKIGKLLEAGMQRKNIIADFGIGFGKSQEGCFELLKRADEFETLGVPLLLGISRKSFIRKEFNLSCEDADVPTALYSAMLKNINIHRVHNVKLTKQFLEYGQKI